jgi:hypothetical protein
MLAALLLGLLHRRWRCIAFCLLVPQNDPMDSLA